MEPREKDGALMSWFAPLDPAKPETLTSRSSLDIQANLRQSPNVGTLSQWEETTTNPLTAHTSPVPSVPQRNPNPRSSRLLTFPVPAPTPDTLESLRRHDL